MSEFLSTLDETLRALAAGDPELRRFGAASHRYARTPVIDDPAVLAPMPDDLRAYAARVAGGGVGPHRGLLALAHVRPIEAPSAVTAWRRALPIAHAGCGQVVVVPLDGDARGEVWIDAGDERIAPVFPSFTAYYLDWIDRLARGRLPQGLVPPGSCALARALSSYIELHEQRLGRSPGSLAGAELRAVLDALGPGAIEIAGEPPLFARGEPVDPCVTCAVLVENLAAEGLRRDVVRAGLPPLCDRDVTPTC